MEGLHLTLGILMCGIFLSLDYMQLLILTINYSLSGIEPSVHFPIVNHILKLAVHWNFMKLCLLSNKYWLQIMSQRKAEK